MPDLKVILQPEDQQRYATCKQVLQEGIAIGRAIFAVIGAAAREIKEKEWFRADGYDTWKAFVEAEYPWTTRYVNQLIVDAEAINSLPESLRKLITSHQAAAELAKVPEALRISVVATASDGGKAPVTAKTIKKSNPVPKRPDKKPATAPPKRPATAKKNEPPPKPKGTGVTDSTGIEVPQESIELWNRSPEVKELLTYLSAVKSRLVKAQEANDKLFAEVNITGDLAILNQACEDIMRGIPFAVCPSCQGKAPADCKLCLGRGFVSRFFWRTCVPEETRSLRPTP